MASNLEPGMEIGAKLRLVRPLNQGGMGSVWIAFHLALKTEVVVKFMSEELARDPEARARFEREASAASRVKSPHVVQTLDYGVTSEGLAYIAMELLEGRDLDSLFAERTPTPSEIVEIVNQVARALARAHERGVIHRDIKPSNIFLSDAGDGGLFVKVLDFGIAKVTGNDATGAATRTGTIFGSPYYMSPEQIIGAKDVDARTDIWSLGVVAFEGLTGKRPFEADTIGALSLKIHNEAPPRPSALAPTLPSSVDAWFERACARDPARRFASAVALAEGLAVALSEHRPIVRAPRMGGDDPRDATGSAPTASSFASGLTPPSPKRSLGRLGMAVGFGAGVVLVGAAGWFVLRRITPASVAVASPPSLSSQQAPVASASTVPSVEATPIATATSAASVGTASARPSAKRGSKTPKAAQSSAAPAPLNIDSIER